jgi:hypothetical protein
MRNQQNLKAILEQLSRQAYEICEAKYIYTGFEQLHESHMQDQSRPSLQDLRNELSKSIQSFERSYVIIDALDEYRETYTDTDVKDLIELLLSLSSSIKVLITSRIIGNLPKLFQDVKAIELKVQSDPHDVDTYLGSRINVIRQQMDISDELEVQIRERVKAVATGRCVILDGARISSGLIDFSPGF